MSEWSLESAVQSGLLPAWHAERQPHVPAVVSDYGELSFAELEGNVNRLARYLREHAEPSVASHGLGHALHDLVSLRRCVEVHVIEF